MASQNIFIVKKLSRIEKAENLLKYKTVAKKLKSFYLKIFPLID
jgi:hypothetical protein